MNKMNKETILEYLKENTDVIRDLVSECNNWDGSLEDYRYYENDEEFFNMFFEGRIDEAVRATYYGDYRYTDEYVRFNGYGNLDSVNEYQLEDELQDGAEEIFDTWFELYQDNNVNTCDNELEEMIEELEDE